MLSVQHLYCVVAAAGDDNIVLCWRAVHGACVLLHPLLQRRVASQSHTVLLCCCHLHEMHIVMLTSVTEILVVFRPSCCLSSIEADSVSVTPRKLTQQSGNTSLMVAATTGHLCRVTNVQLGAVPQCEAHVCEREGICGW